MINVSDIANGTATLHADAPRRAGEPARDLQGDAILSLKNDWGSARLNSAITARPRTMNGQQGYLIEIGSLTGRIVRNPSKRHERDPDFFGLLGPDEELRINGWKRGPQNGDQHLQLEFIALRQADQFHHPDHDLLLEV